MKELQQQIIKLFKYLFYTVDAAIGGICALWSMEECVCLFNNFRKYLWRQLLSKGWYYESIAKQYKSEKTLEDSRQRLKCIVPSSKAPRQAPWHLWQLWISWRKRKAPPRSISTSHLLLSPFLHTIATPIILRGNLVSGEGRV